MKKSYEELERIMQASSGTSAYYRMFAFCRNFVVTDGVKHFVEQAEAHWLIDVVGSNIPHVAKTKDYFFTVLLTVNKKWKEEGIFRIFREVDGERRVVSQQRIPYVDLPSGKYVFFLFHEGERFVMICPSEY